MRLVKNISEIKANIKEFEPFFRMLFLGVGCFAFFYSILLAEFTNVSYFFALEMWVLVLPVLWFLSQVHVLIAKEVVRMFGQRHESRRPLKLAAFLIRTVEFFSPVPTSPPRLCLASRGASVRRIGY